MQLVYIKHNPISAGSMELNICLKCGIMSDDSSILDDFHDDFQLKVW